MARRRRVGVERASALHRQVTALIDVAQRVLDGYSPESAPAQQYLEQHELAARLRSAATGLVPGWLGAPLDAFPSNSPLPAPGSAAELPRYVRVGLAHPLDDARFPVVVPLLGIGNLAIDADARDPRTEGLLHGLLLRLVAATPAGSLRILPVDATGTTFAPFGALTVAGLMAQPATDSDELRAMLTHAEEWIREPGRQVVLLVIASLPELTEGVDLARIARIAQAGPARRLHLIVAGWPPPPLTAETTQAPLRLATQVTVRNPYSIVGDPPGGAFGTQRSLNAPVYLDPSPPVETIQQVCTQVAAQVAANGSTLAQLLPRELWQESSAEGLGATVGMAGQALLTLRLSDLTPHWLIGGRAGSGKTSFIANVLYGLSTRYGPDELALYLLDLSEHGAFGQLLPGSDDPSWAPHIRAAGRHADREYGLAVLRELVAEMGRRADAFGDSGVGRIVELRQRRQLARIVCVIDEFDALLNGGDRVATEAAEHLDTLAQGGRAYGIHLILSAAGLSPGQALPGGRDTGLGGQFPVRVALAGGADVLDNLNQAADGLGPGEAVVNMAGGLGGPTGASRAHERLVVFPDPDTEPELIRALRHRMWEGRPADSVPPRVFDGRAAPHLPAALPVTEWPTAYLGRMADVPLSLAGFAFDSRPGRHLAVLGPSEVGADLIDIATRSLAVQHRAGSVNFVIAPFRAARATLAYQLDQSLRAAGHRSLVVDPAGFKEVIADTALRDTYIIGFGLDSAPSSGLGSLLRGGPARQVHLLGWWRGLRQFTEANGSAAPRDHIAGLVILNVPGAQTAELLADPELGWHARPNRALLHDRRSGRTDLILPFVPSGQSR